MARRASEFADEMKPTEGFDPNALHVFSNGGGRFVPSEKVLKLRNRLIKFMEDHVYPMESEFYKLARSSSRWTIHPEEDKLKELAKKEGLWNLWIPFDCAAMARKVLFDGINHDLSTDAYDWLLGAGLTNLEYGYLCEIMCSSFWGPKVFNCAAPDTGNMEGKTNFNAARQKQHSMILVDVQSRGVHIKRPLTVFGFDDAPYGHAEITYENVCVPAKNIILGEGRGFEIAQARLSPGRLHHWMKLIGEAERGMQMMVQRANSRRVFGKLISEHDSFLSDMAKCRIELEKTRLFVLEAADELDRLLNKAVRGIIAMAKVAASNMALLVLDKAMQVHGAMGLSSDTVLADLWAIARTSRIADGPDEVHLATIAKLELGRAKL